MSTTLADFLQHTVAKWAFVCAAISGGTMLLALALGEWVR